MSNKKKRGIAKRFPKGPIKQRARGVPTPYDLL
jgi:hypothetical protein